MTKQRAKFEILEDRCATGGPLIIRDIGPWDIHPTVTNLAEEVVSDLLASKLLQSWQRLYYYDSENELSELVVKDGRFAGFAPVEYGP